MSNRQVQQILCGQALSRSSGDRQKRLLQFNDPHAAGVFRMGE